MILVPNETLLLSNAHHARICIGNNPPSCAVGAELRDRRIRRVTVAHRQVLSHRQCLQNNAHRHGAGLMHSPDPARPLRA